VAVHVVDGHSEHGGQLARVHESERRRPITAQELDCAARHVIEATHTSGAEMQARLALEHGRPVFLMRSLLEHSWAKTYAERPGTHVVDNVGDVVGVLKRLYAEQLEFSL
jgi:hypothetical protein